MGMFFLVLTLVAIIVHLVFMKNRSVKNIVEVILLCIIFVNIGLGSTMAGLAHIFNGPVVAKMIGWPSGSLFQYEVGVADVAMGFVGIMCLFIRGNFWLSAILVNSIFLFGCMAGHVRDYIVSGNAAAYNIGPSIIISDLIMPVVLIGLFIILQKLSK